MVSPDSHLVPQAVCYQDARMDEPLDLRGLKCPLPALMTKKALTRLAPGTVLTVFADDPMAAVDIPHMCHGEGHAFDGMTARDGYNAFSITAGSA
jgi:tRNA 2-thiouridine synthesizing protein A